MSEIDIRRLDLALLLVFRDLVRVRRTTEVAVRLSLSQSAISHALARLRDILQDPLFTRRRDGLEPTPRALELLPKVEAMIGLAHELTGGTAQFNPATTSRTFQLAGHDMAIAMVTAPLLKRVHAEAPMARIAQRSVVGARALELLERGEIDLAIGTFAAIPQGFLSEPVLRQKFKVVARKGHPDLRGDPDLDCYLSLDHILVSFRAGFVGRVDEVLQRRGLQRRVVASVPMFLAALAIVAESDLVATLPEAIADQHAARFGLTAHRCPVDVEPFDVLAVRHVRTRADGGIDWLSRLMQRQWS